MVKENIKEGKFAEAKQLIAEFLSKNESNHHFNWKWNKLKLEIAQKEKDTPIIREISFSFIKDRFSSEYYNIYKSTFEQSEWPAKLESMISHYQTQSRWFSSNAADVFVITGQKERLMNYVENYLSLENIERYYTHFSDTKKTLTMFRKAIDHYMDKNTGRGCYERVVGLFKLMKVLEGGEQVVAEMISQYRIQYKNRRAMLEIFDRFG